MTKTRKLTIGAATFVAALSVLAYAGITAYAASSLFGGASFGLGHVVLVSDGSDNPGNTANDYSGISFDDVNGEPFSNLGVLSAEFDVTDDSCGAGSPRFQIAVDTNGDTVSDGNIFVYMGPSPSFSGCVGGSFVSTGNLIGNEDAGRWDYTQLGGPLGGYSGATPTILNGTIVDINIVIDSYWNAAASGGDSEMTTLIDNVTIKKLVGTTYDFDAPPPPTEAKVTIAKYVNGLHATDGNAQSLSFPMIATWDSTSHGAGTGPFSLSSPTYEAETVSFNTGADYMAEEDLTGSNVGASCAENKPFALVGYTVGDDEAEAQGGTPSLPAPSLTNITTDKFIIVWNETCEDEGILTLQKTVVTDSGGTPAVDTDWTLSASGPTSISGVEGNASVTNAVVLAGTYNLSESGGPSGYSASAWVCSGGTQNDGDTVTIADGENVTCTITNNDDFVPAPPPPTNACSAPSTPPPGYTLINGTTANDNVTIAPFTMFVGKGGNDNVKGPADGNYIVCTGTGSDIITLGNGNFTVSAGTGSNSVTTGNGDGYISASTGSDKITTGDGEQTIEADGGNNTILTGNGDKTVTTGTGNDNITTGSGNDVISASTGTNSIKAGAGDDTITAGTGNDIIDGGANTDSCNAGGGVNSISNCEA